MRRLRAISKLDEAEPDIKSLDKLTREIIDKKDKKYKEACLKCDQKRADDIHYWLKYHYGIRAALQKVDGKIPKPTIVEPKQNGVFTIQTHGLLLHEINQTLIDGSGNENECYCTGIFDRKNNLATLTNVLPLELSRQTACFAEGDIHSVDQALLTMERWGLPALLFCHNHPGRGAGAVTPSGIDINTHKQIEVYYPMIGAIFSQDGYVRFFSAGKKFKVEVIGNGVVKINDNLYRIQN
jgi:hypothetical protein